MYVEQSMRRRVRVKTDKVERFWSARMRTTVRYVFWAVRKRKDLCRCIVQEDQQRPRTKLDHTVLLAPQTLEKPSFPPHSPKQRDMPQQNGKQDQRWNTIASHFLYCTSFSHRLSRFWLIQYVYNTILALPTTLLISMFLLFANFCRS